MRPPAPLREPVIRARALAGIRHVVPDFLIIGIRKGGTSSLHRYLRHHPYVRGPAKKEPRFFHAHWERGLLYYRTFFPLASEQRRFTAAHGRPFVTFEATPSYLYWPEVPERASRVMPHGRFVALLRNPIDRAFSDHHAMTQDGREHRSFADAIDDELRLHANGFRPRPVPLDPDGAHRKLLAFGCYAEALERWWRHVPEERLLVLVSEDFFADEVGVVRQVVDFLGLPPLEGYDHTPANQGAYEDRIDPALRSRMQEFFEPHNQRLYELLGRDLGWR
jgi:hypothetical protein